MALRVVVCGDSRVEGYGDKADFPQFPSPSSTFGSAYATDTNVIITVVPKAGAPGSGFTAGVKRIVKNGNICAYTKTRGSGYTSGNMPTVTVSGGSGTPPDFAISTAPGGGLTPGLEAYLIANGFPGAVVINAGIDGATTTTWNSPDMYYPTVAEGMAGDPSTSLIYMDIGINDVTSGMTPTAYHDNLLAVVNFWVTDGYNVMISYPFGTRAPQSTAFLALNPNVQGLKTQIDAIIATNPNKIFMGVDNYTLFLNGPAPGPTAYYGDPQTADGLHQQAAGDAAIVGILGPRIAQVMAVPPPVDPYKSDYTNAAFVEVNFKPNPPGSFTATGLGTALRPEGDLIYTVPANMQGGRIVFERRLHGTTDPWVAIGKVDGPDANTPPPATYQDLTVLNSITYEWRAYALPKGDFNPAVFP